MTLTAGRRTTLTPHAHPSSPPGPDDVLYVACSQSGLAAEPSDFLLAIDLRDGVEHRALGEVHFDAAGEEVRAAEWASADRSRLAVLGTGSSQLYLVDIATEPDRPRLEKAVTAAELEDATGCRRPTAAAALPDGDLLVALRSGGASGHGGLAVLSGGDLRPLGGPASAPPGPIVGIAASGRAGRAAAICDAGSWALAVWDLGGGIDDVCELPAVACAVTASAAGEPGGFLACADGALLRWDIGAGRLEVRRAGALPAPSGGGVIGLAESEDGRRLYAGDWSSGVLASYLVERDGDLRPADRLSLGGRGGTEGDAEGPRWDEMIRRGGRGSLAGPANLTLTPGGGALVVTNGAWAEEERGVYPTFCSWLTVVECGEDGSLRVDHERVMSVVNRPAGPARYGQARTSWRPPR